MPKQKRVRNRPEEDWAARCISEALGNVELRKHDDGSSQSMYDFSLLHPGRNAGAVEVTSELDSDFVELWKIIAPNGEPWVEPNLLGGWLCSVYTYARGKRLRVELPQLLAILENNGKDDIRGSGYAQHAVGLGIPSLERCATSTPGSIWVSPQFPMARTSGGVPTTGDPIVQWFNGWVRHPKRLDNRRKLSLSAATERHLFVIIDGFADVPFEVGVALMNRSGPSFPTMPPDLPPEITHLWLVGMMGSGPGLRWSSDGKWQAFAKARA